MLEAPNADEAIAAATAHAGDIHLLFTDVVMPRIGGRELAERLAEGRPHMRRLFTSGYTDDAVFRHGVIERGLFFIQKPFTDADLGRKVREVLDAADATSAPAR